MTRVLQSRATQVLFNCGIQRLDLIAISVWPSMPGHRVISIKALWCLDIITLYISYIGLTIGHHRLPLVKDYISTLVLFTDSESLQSESNALHGMKWMKAMQGASHFLLYLYCFPTGHLGMPELLQRCHSVPSCENSLFRLRHWHTTTALHACFFQSAGSFHWA